MLDKQCVKMGRSDSKKLVELVDGEAGKRVSSQVDGGDSRQTSTNSQDVESTHTPLSDGLRWSIRLERSSAKYR